jgi:hypothetical protein
MGYSPTARWTRALITAALAALVAAVGSPPPAGATSSPPATAAASASPATTGPIFQDDFEAYPTGSPPAGYHIRGANPAVTTPTIVDTGTAWGKAVEFPYVGWQYWDQFLIKDGLELSGPFTVTVKMRFLTSVADRAGLAIGWRDATGDHIGIEPNVYGDGIEFRVSDGLGASYAVTGGGGLQINANTDYWLRVATDRLPNGDDSIVVYWSTNGSTFTEVLRATGPSSGGAATHGMIGVSHAGPNLPQVRFDNLAVDEPTGVSCSPGSDGARTTVSAGDTVTCSFAGGSGSVFSGWAAEGWGVAGFSPASSTATTTTFTAKAGAHRIVGRWTDAGGTHSATFTYTLPTVPFKLWAPWTRDLALGIPGYFYGEVTHVNTDLYAVDYGNGTCNTPILAAFAGTVTKGNDGRQGYGKYVLVTDPTGTWQARYAHLSDVTAKDGKPILHGDPVGLMGETGNADGCHLHFALYHLDAVGTRTPVPLPEELAPQDDPDTASIVSYNAPPVISITDWEAPGGVTGDTTAVFFLSLPAAEDREVTVSFDTKNGTARRKDYIAGSGTVVFAPGETLKMIFVLVTGRADRTSPVTFEVVLRDPVNAEFPGGAKKLVATGTILPGSGGGS